MDYEKEGGVAVLEEPKVITYAGRTKGYATKELLAGIRVEEKPIAREFIQPNAE